MKCVALISRTIQSCVCVTVWVFPCQRYGLWDQEGPLEEKSTEEKKKKADEVIEDRSAEPDEAEEPQTAIKTETQTEPEETQNPEITLEPEEPKKKGGFLRFRKKKSSDKGKLKK